MNDGTVEHITDELFVRPLDPTKVHYTTSLVVDESSVHSLRDGHLHL